MGQLTSTQLAAIAGFRADILAALTADLNAGQAIDAISAAGALSLDRRVTELSISGTMAFTLAAPTAVTQTKVIRVVGAASTPVGTLTISSPDDTAGFICPATIVFDTVGQELTLEATAALKWRVIRVKRAGQKAVTVGTTVLTGCYMAAQYLLSVTGTVSSTTTKGIPDGLVPGEVMHVGVGTAASTPNGTISITAQTVAGVAATSLSALDATTDNAAFMWTGTKWLPIQNTGITVS